MMVFPHNKPFFMKCTISRLCILAAAWMILGSTAPARHNVSTAKQVYYYWYWSDGDVYVEYTTTSNAITDFSNWTGKLVNTQPGGGTLVANGYSNNNYPHTFWPAVQLYAH